MTFELRFAAKMDARDGRGRGNFATLFAFMNTGWGEARRVSDLRRSGSLESCVTLRS